MRARRIPEHEKLRAMFWQGWLDAIAGDYSVSAPEPYRRGHDFAQQVMDAVDAESERLYPEPQP